VPERLNGAVSKTVEMPLRNGRSDWLAAARSANANSAVPSGGHLATSVVEYDAWPNEALQDAQRDACAREHPTYAPGI
jgi:hypothetical protein